MNSGIFNNKINSLLDLVPNSLNLANFFCFFATTRRPPQVLST